MKNIPTGFLFSAFGKKKYEGSRCACNLQKDCAEGTGAILLPKVKGKRDHFIVSLAVKTKHEQRI